MAWTEQSTLFHVGLGFRVGFAGAQLKERGRTICTNSPENCLRKLFLLGWVVFGMGFSPLIRAGYPPRTSRDPIAFSHTKSSGSEKGPGSFGKGVVSFSGLYKLEILESSQSVENRGESDRFLEISENSVSSRDCRDSSSEKTPLAMTPY